MTCPVPGCQTTVERGKLMCRPHWFSASAPTRKAVNKTWREMNDRTLEPEQRRMAIGAYRDARDRAIAEASR